MRRPLIVLGIALFVFASGAPAEAIHWPTGSITKQFGTPHPDGASAISVDAVVGTTYRPAGADGFLRLVGPHGAPIWSVRIDSGADDRVVGVARVQRKIFIAGTTTGSLGHGKNAGGIDTFVQAYSLHGTLRWTRQFGTPQDDVATSIGAGDLYGLSVAGWTTGAFGAPSAGGADVFVLHLARGGAPLWTTQFGTTGDDRATCIDPYLPELICGTTDGELPGGSAEGGLDGFIARLTQDDGSIAWSRQFGTASDDIPAGAAEISTWGSMVAVAGTTSGSFPGNASSGGADAFVATFFDVTDPALQDVKQFGTTGDDVVTGLFSTGGLASLVGQTDGVFPGNVGSGGVDGWAAELDEEVAPAPTWGLLWVRQFGTPGDETVGGLTGPLNSWEATTWVYAVGGTSGDFAGQPSFGADDAFWSLQFESNDTLAKDVLLRGLIAAERYRDANGGSFAGFDKVDGATLSPSFVWQDNLEPNQGFEIAVASASSSTVRLAAFSPQTQTGFCIEESGGVVSYGHGAYDPDSCTGGW